MRQRPPRRRSQAAFTSIAHALSPDRSRPPEFLIESHELRTELPRQPEVTRIIGGEASRQRNLEGGGVVNCDLLGSEPVAQLESGKKRFALMGVAPALRDANICKFE